MGKAESEMKLGYLDVLPDAVVLIDVDTSVQTQTISIIYVAQETGQIGQKENIFYLSTESVSMSCSDD